MSSSWSLMALSVSRIGPPQRDRPQRAATQGDGEDVQPFADRPYGRVARLAIVASIVEDDLGSLEGHFRGGFL